MKNVGAIVAVIVLWVLFMWGSRYEAAPDPIWYRVYSSCVEVDGAALAQRVSDCAGSAASDEGPDIVRQCEDTMRRALCTRTRWTYEELTGSSWNGNRVIGRGLCSKGPPRAQRQCRWEGWDGLPW